MDISPSILFLGHILPSPAALVRNQQKFEMLAGIICWLYARPVILKCRGLRKYNLCMSKATLKLKTV